MGSDSVAHAVLGASSGGGNTWDMQRMDFLDGVAAPRKKAEQEYDVYVSYMHGMFQPTMKSQQELGFIDKEGNPQEPIYNRRSDHSRKELAKQKESCRVY